MPEVKIHHDDGSTDTIPQTTGWKHRRTIGQMEKLTVSVDRLQLDNITLEPKADSVELAGVTRGRLMDVERRGSSHRLNVYSFEKDAKREVPLDGGTLKEGTDKEIITDLINEVSAWSVGSVAELTGPMSFVLNHAFAHEALRRIEKNVPGELRWNDDGSVAYVQNLGTDKSGSITLSPSSRNLDREIKITNQGRDLDSTLMRIIGAHEGEAQINATLVPDDDPVTYDNRVNYSTTRWEPGDVRDFGWWENKDVSSQNAIEEEAAAIADELTETLVEAKATVVGEDLSVGDWVHVEKPEAGVDRDMRVHRITTKQSGATVVDDVLLSTRTMIRSEEENRLRDVMRYNVAFEGSSVSVQGGGSRQPVDSEMPAEIPFDYPSLEYENEVELQVRGLNYRHYSSPQEHSHDIGINVTSGPGAGDASNTSIGQAFTFASGAYTESTNFPSVSGDGAIGFMYVTLSYSSPSDNSSPSNADASLNITNTTKGRTIYNDSTGKSYAPGTSKTYFAADVGGNIEGDGIDITYDIGSMDSACEFYVSWSLGLISDHVHLVDETETTDTEPGVISGIEETFDTPSNVDVVVNGTTVATDIGSGTFQTEVDLSGELNPGQWNMIELKSDSLGHIQAVASVDGYKRIGAGN